MELRHFQPTYYCLLHKQSHEILLVFPIHFLLINVHTKLVIPQHVSFSDLLNAFILNTKESLQKVSESLIVRS